jgi:hypothetical protein
VLPIHYFAEALKPDQAQTTGSDCRDQESFAEQGVLRENFVAADIAKVTRPVGLPVAMVLTDVATAKARTATCRKHEWPALCR